jgi:hypothetical protein
MDDDDEDDDDIIFNADGGHSRAVHLKDNPDAEYENEFGYALLKALRGKTVGRRLKRNIFKFGVLQLLCNFALLMIAIQACKWTLFRAPAVVFLSDASSVLFKSEELQRH